MEKTKQLPSDNRSGKKCKPTRVQKHQCNLSTILMKFRNFQLYVTSKDISAKASSISSQSQDLHLTQYLPRNKDHKWKKYLKTSG